MNKILFIFLIALNVNFTFVNADDDEPEEEIAKAGASNVSDPAPAEKSDVQQKINSLSGSGFKCNKESQSVKIRGYVCIGKVSSYSENIRVYIPENFDSGATAKFNIFFHGLRRNDTFLEDSTGQGYGDYGARLKESNNNNSILIIPESSSGVSSYEQFSRNPDKLLNMLKEIQNKSEIKMSEMTIAGHSGAYRVINGLLGDKNIRSQVNHVGLFDSIYAPLPNVETWIKENQQNKLRIAWLSGTGESTVKWTTDFLTRMSKYSDQITNLKIKGSPPAAIHMNIMQTGGLADFINGD